MPFIREKDNQPVTRNRTLFFLSVRDTSTFGSRRPPQGPFYGADVADDDERGGLLREHRVDFSQGLPPKWSVLLLCMAPLVPASCYDVATADFVRES